ncbi:hypothetical protein [Nitrospina watsonii]|uniref:Uncharacterized protein n=1 Tax=Nitrospina watsonii TaxID=1323948 RepID=A0ABN8W358_9BACT|nr:hypothetical protein [Nitrospina watsonii]CAI2719491.1 conserved protein of unknown function [Nitrospina watsonii]
MHEVKVFDSSGNLKKVISVKSLQKRSAQLIEKPSMFRKNRKTGGKPEKTPAKVDPVKATKARKKA